jgi:hypothetical protein
MHKRTVVEIPGRFLGIFGKAFCFLSFDRICKIGFYSFRAASRIMADSSREYFRGGNSMITDNSLIGMNGGNATTTTTTTQWGGMKPGAAVAGSYYPFEWKVEDKKPGKQMPRGVGTMSTVNVSTVDIKHVTQIPITQTTRYGFRQKKNVIF